MNQIIDQIIKHLEKLKVKNEIKNVILSSGRISITASIKNGRITLFSRQGQTALDFDNRKIETIRHLANCMMQAVEVAEDKHNLSKYVR